MHPGSGEGEPRRALYLRWRPRTFADVVDQDAVTQTLKNAVARGTVAHGYLLCGPRGTGKTSLARILYKALNCQRPSDGEPCGSCSSCADADAGRALDLIEIDAASNRGIDDIRALRERVRFAPTEARWKVYIVDEAHQLTAPAWDAFLKTLEEPPPSTVFVLATTAAHKVPPTIVSRCQRFDLGRIGHAAIMARLERIAEAESIDLQPGVAERLARLAQGGLRDAIGTLEQVAAFAGNQVTLEAAGRVLGLVRGDAIRSFLDALAHRDSRQALQVLEELADEGADLVQLLEEILFNLRAALLVRSGAERAIAGDLSDEERLWLKDLVQHWSPGRIASVLHSFATLDPTRSDERQLLVRLELASVWACGTESDGVALELSERRAPAAPLAGGTFAPLPANPVLQPLDPMASSGPTAVGPTAVEPAAVNIEVEGHPGAPGASGTADLRLAELPSLAQVQSRWPAVLDRFQGNLLAKVQLGRVAPSAIEGAAVTFRGKLDRLEVQRLDASSRASIEALLGAEFGAAMTVRFEAEGSIEAATAAADPLGDLAAALFGGQVVVEPSDSLDRPA